MFRSVPIRFCALALAGLLSLGVVACGSGGGGHDTGTMVLSITDAPFPATEGCVSAAWVDLVGVNIRGGEEGGWTELSLMDGDEPTRIDLLKLRAGLSDQLGAIEVPTGAYDEVRLVIDGAELEFDDGSPAQPFKVPSGQSSGIKVKIDPPLLVASGQTSELLLDVDLTKSFHTTGLGGEPTCNELKAGEGGVIFRPVIRAINLAETSLVMGIVMDSGALGIEGAEVAVRDAGDEESVEPIIATISVGEPTEEGEPAKGAYAVALEPGTYDFWVRLPDAENGVVVAEGVVVGVGEVKELDLVVPE